jgi:hypothetical protein
MSFGFGKGALLVLLVIGAGGPEWVHAQPQTDAGSLNPVLPETPGSEVFSNLNQSAMKPEGRKRFEKELKKNYKGLSLDNSLGGLPAPDNPLPQTARPALQNKQLQEMIERRKEWIFMRPEDFTAGPSMEQTLGVREYDSDGQEKKKLSPMERYFENLWHRNDSGKDSKKDNKKDKRAAGSKSDDERTDDSDSAFGFGDDDSGLPPGVKESEKKLRNMLDSDSSKGILSHSQTHHSILDIFGLSGGNEMTPEQIREHADYMKRYQQLLGDSTQLPGSGLGSFDPSGPAAGPGATLNSILPSLKLPTIDTQVGAVNPTVIPGLPEDPTTKILNQWNPSHGYELPEPAKPAPTYAPLTDFPRRKF